MYTDKMLTDRFSTKVTKGKIKGSCWLWVGNLNHNGYGRFSFDNKYLLAHRYSFKQANPTIQIDGLCVCHKCDTPKCVNPKHLFIGTPRDNVYDMLKKDRQSKRNSNICKDVVLKLRTEYSDGSTVAFLSKKYGISYTGVANIVKLQRWKHLYPPLNK